MLRRLGGFTLLPLLSLVTPFVLLPVVARVAGPQGWSSVVAGQSVGTFGATVVFWGWNVIGPVEAARARGPELTGLYGSSLRTRLLLLAPVLPAAALVSAVVAQPGYRAVAASMALATSLLGLSPAWWGIGVGRPAVLFWYDTVPRVAAAALAVPVVLATRAIWTYPLLLVVATVVGLVAFQRRHAPGADWSPLPLGRAARELQAQAGTAGVNLVGTAYAATPAPVATAAFPGAVASPLSSADAVYRLGLFAVVATGNAFQGWTLEPDADRGERARRHRTAVLAHLALGVAGLLVLALLGPWLTGLLFGAPVAASRELGVAYGAAFLLISASTPYVRNLLLPAGRTRLVLAWTAASAVAGLAVMLVAAARGWLAGVAWGMAASELVLLLGVLGPALRVRRAL
ncbi:polysaccharide biosynthesis protein [Lapillicoccus jejuensis]|uniref:O-antigen/teichoic acid export membrane protein n=1 Tax=Lapillicoccus jejuensis TaxID=402171 RepID=A0A542E054_9MICO|nr:polysaccharide biosynthesis protein [Lapillicoccus jejuensis]TQJ08718.1 O-antigen/teichoic acid export membrane protein [Lapillicoccus jejuensis]